jgi:hypothetical protein
MADWTYFFGATSAIAGGVATQMVAYFVQSQSQKKQWQHEEQAVAQTRAFEEDRIQRERSRRSAELAHEQASRLSWQLSPTTVLMPNPFSDELQALRSELWDSSSLIREQDVREAVQEGLSAMVTSAMKAGTLRDPQVYNDNRNLAGWVAALLAAFLRGDEYEDQLRNIHHLYEIGQRVWNEANAGNEVDQPE